MRACALALAVGIGLLLGPISAAEAVTSLSVTGTVTDSITHTLDGASSVKVAGHYAYVAADIANALTVVDVSDPAHPVEVGSVTSLGLTGATGVDVVGDYAYVTSRITNSLTVVDVSTPTQPVIVGSVQDSDKLNGAYTVQVVGNDAYVAAQGCVPFGCTAKGGNALTIVDVSDPANPHVVGSVSDPTATHHLDSVVVVGTKAYGVAFYSNTFTTFDVSDPAHPTILGSKTDNTTLQFGSDVEVSGSYAYVLNQTSTGRLTVVDVSNPATPTVVGSVASSTKLDNAYALRVAGHYAFVAARDNNALTVVDISNPAAPAIVDSLSDVNALGTPLEVSLQRGQAFVAAYCAGPCATATSSAISAVNVGAYVAAPDVTPPQTSVDSGPDSLTRDTTASFSLSATEADSTFECRIDGGRWRACSSTPQYSSLSDGSHLLEAAATDPSGNLDTTPASWAWVVDTQPPDTSIGSGPSGTVNATSASFTFTSTEAGSTFDCTLDGAPVSCAPAGGYQNLADGSHTFAVAAVDQAGNVDPSPAIRTWTVDTQSPTTAIDSAPAALTKSRTATFKFHASEPNVTFSCTLDGVSQSCSSPVSYGSLPDGSHTFKVTATDAAGNVESAPPSVTWTVDSTAPDTSIDAGPSGTTTSNVASFVFSSTEGGSTFACTLDGSPVPCSPVGGYQNLAEGTHSFTVAATDPAGNTDSTPASRTWIVDAQLPTTTIDSRPDAVTSSQSASFQFHSSESDVTFSCELDGTAAPCSSPASYGGLPDGKHSFKVTATDAAGNVEVSPPVVTWTVDSSLAPAPQPAPNPPPTTPSADTTPPSTTIVSGPPSKNHHVASHFVVSSSEPGSTFQCRLDRPSWRPCGSDFKLPALHAGLHVFAVRAVDAAGNVDPTPAYRNWQTGKPHVRLRPGARVRLTLGPQAVAVTGTIRISLAAAHAGRQAVRVKFKAGPDHATPITVKLRPAVLGRARSWRVTAVISMKDTAGARSSVRYSFTLTR